MSGLEELLANAIGDEPWYHADHGEIRTKNPDELRLIALAPDLARLALDMGEIIKEWADLGEEDCGDPECADCAYDRRVGGVLARLNTLEQMS